MPANARPKTARAAHRNARRSSASPQSAIALLKADHREVEGWFGQYEDLEDNDAKAELAKKICAALKAHTQVEEEIFYPAAAMDMNALGKQMAAGKAELMAKAG